jgi:phosphoribosylglycinamide formyltransferase 1
MNMRVTDLPRLVVLISGSGSNLQAILDACASSLLPAHVVLVVSNRPDAYGLERAARAEIQTIVMEKPKGQDRRVYDAELARQVAAYHPDWIVLAGWMRILTSAFLDVFKNRVINLHPALPGTFPGAHAILEAYQAFQRGEIHQTGVMVHLVPDEGIDCGPVLGQAVVSIEPTDSLESLEARIHQAEHQLLVQTLIDVFHNHHLITPEARI